jgi:hypothetical protein
MAEWLGAGPPTRDRVTLTFRRKDDDGTMVHAAECHERGTR